MIQRIRAVYRNGAFIPEENVDFAEDTHVEITVESAAEPRAELSEEERQRLTLELLRSMQANPLPPDAPRFTREQLHERR
jgi:predicted DNA-binding antitoxin AbrB/MazE fold protein